jgi:hypothetical protein
MTVRARLIVGAATAILCFLHSTNAGAQSWFHGLTFENKLVCKRVCSGSTLRLTYWEANAFGQEQCPITPTVVQPCAPYSCDSRTQNCKPSCASDSDCSSGHICDRSLNECVHFYYFCDADGIHLNSPRGQEADCTPYHCAAGQCKFWCTYTFECVGDNLCQANNQCAPPIRYGNKKQSD